MPLPTPLQHAAISHSHTANVYKWHRHPHLRVNFMFVNEHVKGPGVFEFEHVCDRRDTPASRWLSNLVSARNATYIWEIRMVSPGTAAAGSPVLPAHIAQKRAALTTTDRRSQCRKLLEVPRVNCVYEQRRLTCCTARSSMRQGYAAAIPKKLLRS